jgi:hypothetical protein
MKSAEIIDLSTSGNCFKEALLHSSSIRVDHVEYRTLDEGLCSASIFFCKKETDSLTSFAFLALMNHALHFYEEWNIKETFNNEIDLIVEKWLVPAIHKAEDIPHEDARKNIQGIIESIEICINKKINSGATYNSERWGVFLNHNRSPSYPSSSLFPCESNVIALADKWNEVEYLYETPNSFALFCWSTGA